MTQPPRVPPARIPVLTEVLDDGRVDDETSRPMLDAALAPIEEAPAAEAATDEARAAASDKSKGSPALDDEALVARVLEGLHRQIDTMIDRRVQAALEPIWRRLTEDLADEARLALALSLKETLREAVRDEVRRAASTTSGAD